MVPLPALALPVLVTGLYFEEIGTRRSAGRRFTKPSKNHCWRPAAKPFSGELPELLAAVAIDQHPHPGLLGQAEAEVHAAFAEGLRWRCLGSPNWHGGRGRRTTDGRAGSGARCVLRTGTGVGVRLWRGLRLLMA